MPKARRLLGLDPGLRSTGWGVIELDGTRLRHLGNGTLRTNDRLSLAERLVELERALILVVNEWRPDAAAVENAFMAKDAPAALKLGQARAICLLVPAREGLPVAEYASTQVKKAVVGAGHAAKDQVGLMVSMLLPGISIHSEHSADALAIAITHAHMGASASRIEAALAKAGASR